MNILSFHKISRPIYEGGATIDLSPKAVWQIRVRRSDGTYRYPFGDNWIPNLFINRFANGLLGSGQGTNWGTNPGPNAWTETYSFIGGYFYGTGKGRKFAVGSSSVAATASQTALQSEIRADSTASSGNDASISFTNGDISYTISETFPTETSTVTYNEAAIKQTTASSGSAGMINGLTSAGIFNRLVFPGPVILQAGEALALKLSITINSCASTNGKTITIAAQNGVNISGALKLIGTSASILGGVVTSAGSVTSTDTTYPLLFNTNQTPNALLSTATTFSTQGTNPTWGDTNTGSGAWSAYSTDSRLRDATFTWGNGTPASNTNFRSILMRSGAAAGISAGTVRGGYQLLLDNEMTKDSTATLILSLRFTV
jgi:hypothetical protein